MGVPFARSAHVKNRQGTNTAVLSGPELLGRLSELRGCAECEVRIAQKLTADQDGVRVTVAQDLFSLAPGSNETNCGGERTGGPSDLGRKWHLISRLRINVLVGDDAARGHVEKVGSHISGPPCNRRDIGELEATRREVDGGKPYKQRHFRPTSERTAAITSSVRRARFSSEPPQSSDLRLDRGDRN